MEQSSCVNGAGLDVSGRNPAYTNFFCAARIYFALIIVALKLFHKLLIVPALIAKFLSPEMVGFTRNVGNFLSKSFNRLVPHFGVFGSLL